MNATRGKYSGDELAVEFDERITVECKGPGMRVGLNVDYLETICGVWPLRIMWKSSEYLRDGAISSMVVFAGVEGGSDDSWRAVIMPMRV